MKQKLHVMSGEDPRGLLSNEDGYLGAFTRAQAEGAFPNGSRIRKSWSEANDTTPVGTEGVVMGSMAIPEGADVPDPTVKFFYFVEWDDKPRIVIGMIDRKISLAETVS